MTITTYPHPTCGTGYRLASPSGRCAARVWRPYGLTGPQVGAWAWEGGRYIWRDDAEPWICSRCPAAREALGSTYEGWKGGEYTMDEGSACHLVPAAGSTGETIGPVLLEYMTDACVDVQS